MTAKTYLVTGANRGLGIEFVKQVLEKPETKVLAGARSTSNSDGLLQLKQQYGDRLHVLPLDVGDQDSIKAAMEKAGELLPDGLDYLICNAGVVGDHVRASEESSESVERVWRINFMGFLLSVQTALPLLRKGNAKTVIGITSGFSSLALMTTGISSGNKASVSVLSYKVSKVAMNMEGFTVVAMDPGWVATDMGTHHGGWLMDGLKPPLDAVTSVSGMLKVIEGLTPAQNGAALQYTGEVLPW